MAVSVKVTEERMCAVFVEITVFSWHSSIPSALMSFAWNTVVQTLLAFILDFVKIASTKTITDSPYISAEVFKFCVMEELKKLLI